jgi:DNA-binding transcriptional ArsR family regulator
MEPHPPEKERDADVHEKDQGAASKPSDFHPGRPFFFALGAVGFTLVAYAARKLWWVPIRVLAVPLFARLTRRDITRHPTRAMILEAVAASPGISVAALADRSELNVGTLDYHVAVLQRDGQLRAKKAGRNRLLFLPGADIDVEGIVQVSARGRGDVARAILGEPGLFSATLAQRVGLSPATVHHHLSKLEASGLIRVERGSRVRCFPTDRLPRALEPLGRRRVAVPADAAHGA